MKNLVRVADPDCEEIQNVNEYSNFNFKKLNTFLLRLPSSVESVRSNKEAKAYFAEPICSLT